jgi:hypothetical protein
MVKEEEEEEEEEVKMCRILTSTDPLARPKNSRMDGQAL